MEEFEMAAYTRRRPCMSATPVACTNRIL